ncbi:MAG: hypothetical protein A2622_03740 [Bdellovibrionales bacterium RIFCSPHIGHO2_01_FULL_40_29]|nr:MAG: hypothetical protein A2622_03740 [Bdellovibrionales bacterium RIFCSPHIGHO2_01_FULL_40_29]OFZ35371.1 MAG: hypothetical protein A3D17_08290 [Bdellovibrionales bacterium RIFCSPHIGHO2_02_FULL_40_15]
MKTSTAILAFLLTSSTMALASPEEMKIRINNSETLYTASVSQEQIEKNMATLHIYNGRVVEREVAKNAFLNGETSCRVFIDGVSGQMKSQTVADLAMEIPSTNRKMIAFISEDRSTSLTLTCQAQASEVTRASILKALGSLIEEIK